MREDFHLSLQVVVVLTLQVGFLEIELSPSQIGIKDPLGHLLSDYQYRFTLHMSSPGREVCVLRVSPWMR